MSPIIRFQNLGLALLAFSLAFSCASRPADQAPQQKQLIKAVSPPERLAAPQDLPGPARAILRARMASHLQDMGALTAAVMVLAYDRIEEDAAAIAGDVSLARPLTGDATELNSALPEAFFVHQDELRKAATVLGAAAHEQSAVRVADAYGRLSETCVKCHAAYRQGRQPK